MRRIVFVNRFYSPETAATGQLLTDLARFLASRGDPITIVTSRPFGSSAPFRERDGGLEVIRVRSTRGRPTLPGRALAFGTFYLGALAQLFRCLRRGDVLVCLTDPPLLGIPATCVARLRRAHVIHWVHDIYPEVAIAVTGRHALSALRPLRNWMWRAADHCVTLGSDMAAVLAAGGVREDRISRIPNWAPAGLRAIRRDDPMVRTRRGSLGLADVFVVGYSGNLGRVHALEPLINAAEELKDDPRILFLFIGTGAHESRIQEAVRTRGLTNVRLLGPQPRAELSESLAMVDLHVVTLRPGCEHYVFPSKLYGILAAGRPVLFAGPSRSEIAGLVRDLGLGRAIDGARSADIAAAIREFATDPRAYDAAGEAGLAWAVAHPIQENLLAWNKVFDAVNSC